mmetsp:Transcript_5578/g.7939  ORF Transcript_5578/g.7939 Transcript_5578/m.7939 type:complete len:132 (+) Transcript_5578:554-949(+)
MLEPPFPLPTGSMRGNVLEPREGMSRDICQLLVRYTAEYSPSESVLTGYPGMAFNRMRQFNFMCFTCVGMKQVAGVAALTNMCVQGEKFACKEFMFALMEGNVLGCVSASHDSYTIHRPRGGIRKERKLFC